MSTYENAVRQKFTATAKEAFLLPPGEGQEEGIEITGSSCCFDPLSPTLPLRGRGLIG
jgi:hypothetical protein